MTIKIGRVGGDITIQSVAKWDNSGDVIQLSGRYFSTTGSVEEFTSLRQQISGLAGNPDEEVIPVVWGADATVDGFYRVLDCSISMIGGTLTTGAFDFEMTLAKVGGYAGPVFESILVGDLRTNAHSITELTANIEHGIPNASTEYRTIGGARSLGVGKSTQRTSADGIMEIHGFTGLAAGSAALSTISSWRVAAASFYIGAATIETGTTLRVVVGKQIENKATAWRLSNGLVRVTPVTGGKLGFSVFDGSVWDTAKQFRLLRTGPNDMITEWDSITVLRNSPEECSIRLAGALSGWAGTFTLDLTLKRGSRVVECFAAAIDNSSGPGIGIRLETSEAATALTGGFRATSNDASGNRYVLASPVAQTNDLTIGRMFQNVVASTFTFMIGEEVGGSGAAVIDGAQSLIDDYMYAWTERMVVVGR